MSASAPAPDRDPGAGLRRELRFWEAIALSIPIVVAIWLVVGAAITVAFPRLTRSIGQSLARREGLGTEEG